jgi:hypothetical protein
MEVESVLEIAVKLRKSRSDDNRTYIADTPRGVAFFGSCGDLVSLTVDAFVGMSGQGLQSDTMKIAYTNP